jgi:DNA-binding NtrC family response regulator
MTIRVLLVDDAKDFIKYIKKRLDARGVLVSTAHSGLEALAVLNKETIDVVVLDVLMPDMDGIETLQKIKKTKPDLPVIMLTGHGTVESTAEGMRLGAADFLLKPCDADTVLKSIESAHAKSTNS